jgi:type VI secretion system secreted protein VgrG
VSAILQGARSVALSTPLGEDVLVLRHMVARERLGRLFEYELTALSHDHDIVGMDLLGKNVTVRLELDREGTRYFNGFVSSFRSLATEGRLARYQLTLKPWLWFLSRTADCRIFQEMTAPDIVKQVFRDHGFSDFEDCLSATYRCWEYCVQYRETSFDFVSRLLEHEGIYYFFKHEDGKHTLVLADGYGSHETTPGYEEVPFYPRAPSAKRERDHLWEWSFAQSLQPTAYALNSYDFKNPRSSMAVRRSVSRTHDAGDFEVYEYPGNYYETGDGEHYVQARMDELSSGFEIMRGAGDARGLATGALFTLANFTRADQNREYLISSATYDIQADPYEPGRPESGLQFECTLEAMDANQTFKPARTTPKPEIRGPQSAIVVGSSGEEIWTDEFGRIKVKFHWDRYGRGDENSSCWIRVAQSLAGQNWGAIVLPRIGQEVLVEFMEGDPDRPVVTGAVYNGDNMPPYELPKYKTVSGVKTNSSKGGEGFNEIRLEDAKGEEQMFIHAERNQDVRVKNDRFELTGHDRHLIVKNDKFEHVEANRHEQVDLDHVEEIGKDGHLLVKGKLAQQVDGSLSLTVGDDVSELFKSNHSHRVTKDLYVKATNICIEASTNITIKVGQSFIAIEAGGIKIGTTGDIVLDAKMNLKQQAGMNAEIKAGVNAKLDGGVMTDVKGGAMVTVKGGLVKIN